jgi:ABC-type multidrug transport system ATPase subunit
VKATSAARAEDLVKVYGEGPTAVRALDGLSVEFAAGEFTAIMGPSAPGSRRCSTAWPGSTAPPAAGS